MIKSNLYENINYDSGISFLISSYIREYDISKANINILYKYGVISYNDYVMYFNMDKYSREVAIGNLQKNPEVTNTLQKGIIEAKKIFFDANNIKDKDVLAIKNDAVLLINKIAHNTKFENIEFINNETYTSYIKLNTNIKLFYTYDNIRKNELLDVKGINKNNLSLHKDFFIDFLKEFFYCCENCSIDEIIDLVVNFYNLYLNLKLDINYYREFNSESMYSIKSLEKFIHSYKAITMNEKEKVYIDIRHNLDIIRYLYGIISNIYFEKGKR